MSGFTQEQFERGYAEGSHTNYWSIARQLFVRDALRLSEDVRGRVLDVGCGTGGMVSFLREQGLDAYGTEISTPAVPQSIQPFVFTKTDARAMPEPFRKAVHTLLLLDVLEHVEHPKIMLRGLIEAFPDVQRIIITLPARQEVWSNFDEYYGHYLRYDRPGSRALFADTGFSVRRNVYFFHVLYFFVWATVRLFRRRAIDLHPPKIRIIHRLIGHLLFLEAKILPGSLIGSSILVEAVKKDSSVSPR